MFCIQNGSVAAAVPPLSAEEHADPSARTAGVEARKPYTKERTGANMVARKRQKEAGATELSGQKGMEGLITQPRGSLPNAAPWFGRGPYGNSRKLRRRDDGRQSGSDELFGRTEPASAGRCMERLQARDVHAFAGAWFPTNQALCVKVTHALCAVGHGPNV